MEKDYALLVDTIQKQKDVYGKLLSLAQEKQPFLVKGNIAEIERITKEEELLILQVGRLEEQRKALHQNLASHFELSPEELTVGELIKRTDVETALAFESVIQELIGVLGRLGNKNKTNTELIKNSLDFVNFSLNILTSDSVKPAYGSTKEEKQNINSKIFDRTI